MLRGPLFFEKNLRSACRRCPQRKSAPSHARRAGRRAARASVPLTRRPPTAVAALGASSAPPCSARGGRQHNHRQIQRRAAVFFSMLPSFFFYMILGADSERRGLAWTCGAASGRRRCTYHLTPQIGTSSRRSPSARSETAVKKRCAARHGDRRCVGPDERSADDDSRPSPADSRAGPWPNGDPSLFFFIKCLTVKRPEGGWVYGRLGGGLGRAVSM